MVALEMGPAGGAALAPGTICCSRGCGRGEDLQVWFYSLPRSLEQPAGSAAGPDGPCLPWQCKCNEE